MPRHPSYFRSSRNGPERWLISYTDILTLLLILFIAIAAQAIGQSQAHPVPAPNPVVSQPPQPVQTAPASLPETDLARTAAKLQPQGLEIRDDPRGLVLSLPQAVLFASGDDRINPSARFLIEEIADAVRGLDNKIELAGHADSVPIHNRRFKNNWELSAARGLSLLRVLTSDYGIDESRLTVSSYGAFSPKNSNETADGCAENRRVEILILNNDTKQNPVDPGRSPASEN